MAFETQYNQKTGKYRARKPGGEWKNVPKEQAQAMRDTEGVGSIEAGVLNAGNRVVNGVNTFVPEALEPWQSKVMANLTSLVPGFEGRSDMPTEPQMEAINQAHPVASVVGDTAPYAAAGAFAPLVGIPGAIGLGAAEGYIFANKGEEVKDAALGAVSGPVGHVAGRMVGRVVNEIRSVLPDFITPYKKFSEPMLTANQTINGERGFWDNMASKPGAKTIANIYGGENQRRLNQLTIKSLGLDPKQYKHVTEDALTAVRKQVLDKTNANIKRAKELRDIGKNRDLTSSELGEFDRILKDDPAEMRKRLNLAEMLRGKRITNFPDNPDEFGRMINGDKYKSEFENVMPAKQLVDVNGNVRPERITESHQQMSEMHVLDKSKAPDAELNFGLNATESQSGLLRPQLPTKRQDPTGRFPDGYSDVLERSRQMTDPELGVFRGKEQTTGTLGSYIAAPRRGAMAVPHFLSSSMPVNQLSQLGTSVGTANDSYEYLSKGKSAVNGVYQGSKGLLDLMKDYLEQVEQ